MGEFFAGLAVVFALLLFSRGRGGRGPGDLPPGSAGPGNFPPNNPTYNNPPNLPSGPTGSGCGCGSANNYVPPPGAQTNYSSVPPASFTPAPGYSYASGSSAPASTSLYTSPSSRPTLGTSGTPNYSGGSTTVIR